MKFILAIPLMALLLAGCTASQTACSSLEAAKLVFDEFALEGEFKQKDILVVDALYDEGHAICIAPPGTYDQAMIINKVTQTVITIRRITRQSDAAYTVMAPQLDKLESMLRQARNQIKVN